MYATNRPALLAGTATALALATSVAYGVPANAATPSRVIVPRLSHYATSGHAFGSKVQVGNLVGSGKSASTAIGCGATDLLKHNATAHANLSKLGQVRAVRTRTRSSLTSTGAVQTVTHAKTGGVSLLGGAIQLKALTATAAAVGRAGSALTGHSRFMGLRIGGRLFSNNPKPNTTLRIGGLASLTVNAQQITNVDGVRRIKVDALKLTLLHGSHRGRLGTTVIVGQASAAVHQITGSLLRGAASGSQVTVGNLVTSAPTFRSVLPCGNANGNVRFHRGASINLSKLLRTGAVRTRATGRHGLTPSSSTKATIARVNLLNGLVKVRAIKAQANATKVLGHVKLSNLGSHFVGLKIHGKPMNDDISPNTKISLLGIGTLWLDRVIKSRRGVQVHMIELVLGHAINGLRKGTVIDVANARALVRH
jgi:hypothetical protein